MNEKIWSSGAEIFIPAAGSRLVTQDNLDQMVNAGLECISAGANVPFRDPEIFLGDIGMSADEKVALEKGVDAFWSVVDSDQDFTPEDLR